MATIAQQLDALKTWRNQLAANLTTKGVAASNTEKLNTLVPKVLQISTGASDTSILYDATHRNGVYLKYNDTVYSVDSFAAEHADFCSEANEYALNYSNMIFGWDVQVYSCCVTPISVTASTKIAIQYLAGGTETGVVRLVQSETGTASDIITKAQTDGSYVDLSFQWLYSDSYITTLITCDNVTAGTYYLCWIGRSNNSKPKIKDIKIM